MGTSWAGFAPAKCKAGGGVVLCEVGLVLAWRAPEVVDWEEGELLLPSLTLGSRALHWGFPRSNWDLLVQQQVDLAASNVPEVGQVPVQPVDGVLLSPGELGQLVALPAAQVGLAAPKTFVCFPTTTWPKEVDLNNDVNSMTLRYEE